MANSTPKYVAGKGVRPVSRTYFLGVDIGGTNLKAGLVSREGAIVSHISESTRLGGGWQDLVAQLELVLSRLLNQSGYNWEQILGLGVGVPGTVRLPEGMVLFSPNLDWHDVPLLDALQSRFPVKVGIDNDAHVAALGEYWFGAGRGSRRLLMLTLGTGIGSAYLVNGKVYRGRNGLGAEMGHMIVNPAGPLCGCGNHGCLEALVSGPALLKFARELYRDGTATKLSNASMWEIRDVIEAARDGDVLGRTVVHSLAENLSAGVANAVVLVDPDLVLLGGGIAEGASVFLDELKQRVSERVCHMAYKVPPIMPAAKGNLAGVLGAAHLIAGRDISPEEG